MTPIRTFCLGRPTIDGTIALGELSPAKPALHVPDPLSIMRAVTRSSTISKTHAMQKFHLLKVENER